MLEPAQVVEIFQKQPELKTFHAQETIFQAGDEADYMYGIISGEVDMQHHGKILETLKPGDIFGVGGIIEAGQRLNTAIAKTDCQLAYLDRQHFLFAVQETPMFAIEVMRHYSLRLHHLEKAIA
jgi:CRP/FNR family transcriptional regulator, cyclic AMP receptor protein